MVSVRGTTTAAQIRDFERQMRDIAADKIPRGVQYALNGTAIEAAKAVKAALPTVLDNPTPWIAGAFVAKKGDLNRTSLRDVSASLEVKPEQSAVLKYLYGDRGGSTERKPGDVGPAESQILVPNWPGLTARTKVKPNKSGNLARTALAGLFASRSVKGGVFWIKPGVRSRNGRRMTPGLWSRLGPPKLLLWALPKTVHPDLLTEPTRRVAEAAMATLPARLTRELESQIARRNARQNGGGPR